MAIAYSELEFLQTHSHHAASQHLNLVLETLYQQNADTVFSHSESPIETIFLNALALCFLRNSLPLVMVPDVGDVPIYIKEVDEVIPQIHALAEWHKEQGREGSDIIEYLAGEVKSGAITKQERAYLMRGFSSYEWLNLESVYHLAVQAGLPNIKVDGKGIRSDLFFWIPGHDNIRLVVECDGFRYHNSQEAFVRDRKRDRALQNEHFQVRRYPGSDIWNDPIGAANDLFKYLFQDIAVRDPRQNNMTLEELFDS